MEIDYYEELAKLVAKMQFELKSVDRITSRAIGESLMISKHGNGLRYEAVKTTNGSRKRRLVNTDPEEIYTTCEVIMQMLPTHATITHSFDEAIRLSKPGTVLLDLDSTAPDIILDYYPKLKAAGIALLDSPVSGGNPMAIAGTLAIMTGGDKEVFDEVKPLLECMGKPVYTGGPASGSTT